MRPARYLVLIAALGTASACDILPPYRHPPQLSAATVNLAGSGEKWICRQGREHALQGDKTAYAAIPAGTRVTVVGRHDVGLGGKCSAATSLIPAIGQRYRLDLQIAAEHCVATVYIEDTGAVAGLRPEPSALPSPGCSF
ncbi:hypothetical protein [Massilia sp. CCM 8734]|uniref:hypothetical protein n=1 Tax=Massilia sp. CCM 8734 TaxID=2609283 RepID=UPI00141D8520|nr:hypothetical protein [Massilia sp. CCM 8734]NHZ95408.1 hypothetical protein [Massilia sp. CCM 8734]